MHVYTCDNHPGHWPVPTASVVVASNIQRAAQMLVAALAQRGIEAAADDLTMVALCGAVADHEWVRILSDGEY